MNLQRCTRLFVVCVLVLASSTNADSSDWWEVRLQNDASRGKSVIIRQGDRELFAGLVSKISRSTSFALKDKSKVKWSLASGTPLLKLSEFSCNSTQSITSSLTCGRDGITNFLNPAMIHFPAISRLKNGISQRILMPSAFESDEGSRAEVLSFSIARLMNMDRVDSKFRAIHSKNQHRKDLFDIPVGILYLLVAGVLCSILLLGGVWHAWYLCVCPNLCAKVYAHRHARVMWVWAAAYFVIGNILAWTFGIFAWIVISILLGVQIFTFTAVRLFSKFFCDEHHCFRNEIGINPPAFMHSVASRITAFARRSPRASVSLDRREHVNIVVDPQRKNSEEVVDQWDDISRDKSVSVVQRPLKPKVAYTFKRDWKATRKWIVIFSFLLLMCVGLSAVLLSFWKIEDYRVYSKVEQKSVVEFQPPSVGRSIVAIYAFDGFANKMKFPTLFKLQTGLCGSLFNRQLSPGQKKHQIYDNFISRYNINMTQYDPSDYTRYETVNQWFSRRLKPGARVIADSGNDKVLSSPADARVLVFRNFPTTSKFWIKSQEFTFAKLLNDPSLANDFNGATMFNIRLAPKDYHRFHMPVSGRIRSVRRISGSFHSVDAVAMSSENLAILNERVAVIVDTQAFGAVAIVPIGAFCVGSVTIIPTKGQEVIRGDELGYFQFGGSTIVVLIQANVLAPDEMLSLASHHQVETLLRMGNPIGVATGKQPGLQSVGRRRVINEKIL
eukprot:288268_1